MYAAANDWQEGAGVEAHDRVTESSEAQVRPLPGKHAEDELTRLMSRHDRPLYSFLYAILLDPSSVHDCLQDTYMRAYVQLREGRPVETAWLYRVSYNRAMDELRRRWRVKSGEVEVEVEPTIGDVDRLLAIEEAFSDLSILDREVLFLHGCAGYKTDEIGTLLGTSGAAVRQRLYRARDRFRRLYEAEA